jgi:hypothetical protein
VTILCGRGVPHFRSSPTRKDVLIRVGLNPSNLEYSFRNPTLIKVGSTLFDGQGLPVPYLLRTLLTILSLPGFPLETPDPPSLLLYCDITSTTPTTPFDIDEGTIVVTTLQVASHHSR